MRKVVSERVPVAGPSITDREVDYVADAVRHSWYENASEYHLRFERAFAEYVGVRFAMSLPSCTSGLHLSLAALGVGPGDEVVIPDVTWIASSAPISYVGATPVFADISPDTWTITAESFEACVTSRTRAVIPVDLYGGVPDMDAIRQVARRYGIAIVEDAAEAVGSEYKGHKAGSLGDVGVFSFHGSKTLTTGEGGMLVTNREDLYQRALVLRDHGRTPGDTMFRNNEVAYKYKMSSMQAALGLAQLERIEELVSRKREIFYWYARRLQRISGVTLNCEPDGTRNTYWMVTVVLDSDRGVEKERLMAELAAKGIDTRPFFHPLSSLPAYSASAEGAIARSRNTVSYRLSPYGINLPSGFNLSEDIVEVVCDRFKQAIGCR